MTTPRIPADPITALVAALMLDAPCVHITDPAGFRLATIGRRCVAVADERGAFEVAPRRDLPIACDDAVEAARLAVALFGAEPCARAARRMLGGES